VTRAGSGAAVAAHRRGERALHDAREAEFALCDVRACGRARDDATQALRPDDFIRADRAVLETPSISCALRSGGAAARWRRSRAGPSWRSPG
jgi:hypothetical protein